MKQQKHARYFPLAVRFLEEIILSLTCIVSIFSASVALACEFGVDSIQDAPGSCQCSGSSSGQCTLRAAIIAANRNPRSTIKIPYFPNGPAIVLESPLPPITTDLKIDGPGASRMAVEPANSCQCRVFQIGGAERPFEVRIEGITIAKRAVHLGAVGTIYCDAIKRNALFDHNH